MKPRKWREAQIFPTAVLWALVVLACPLGAQGSEGAAGAGTRGASVAAVNGVSGTGPRAQADAFLAQARSWLSAGDMPRAGSFASTALELDPGYSEALFLVARVESADRPSTRPAIDHLREAVKRATWVSTDPVVAEQLLTDLLVRTGQLAEARKAAERLTAARPDDPQNFVLLSRAEDRAGDTSAEQRTLTSALARFPSSVDIRLATARLLRRMGRRAEGAAIIQTGLRLQPDNPPLLLAAADTETDRAKKVSDVELYLSNGGMDPLGPVLGMEAVPVGQRKKYLDIFLSEGGLSRQDLVGRAIDAVNGSGALAASLRDALGRYTGNRDVDADEDGFWEDRWVFENGKVARWIREPAQDGISQFESEFQGGMPVSLSYRDPAGHVTRFSYSRYPSLEKADLPGQGTWMLAPYTVPCVFLRPDFASGPAYIPPQIASRIRIPSLDVIRRAAYQLDEFAADGRTPIRRIDLAAGRRVFMEESSVGNGVFDHRVWYARGEPVRGARSLTGNGVFQVAETWTNGRLSSESIDTSGDGEADYRQTYGAVPMKSWDYNEDGRDDSREYQMPGGTQVRELSTKMNGVFDLRVATRGNRIVSFTRGGAPVPVVPDAARGVTWIGRPAPSGMLDTSLPDGLQTIAGGRYLVFRTAGVVYAEAVQE